MSKKFKLLKKDYADFTKEDQMKLLSMEPDELIRKMNGGTDDVPPSPSKKSGLDDFDFDSIIGDSDVSEESFGLGYDDGMYSGLLGDDEDEILIEDKSKNEVLENLVPVVKKDSSKPLTSEEVTQIASEVNTTVIKDTVEAIKDLLNDANMQSLKKFHEETVVDQEPTKGFTIDKDLKQTSYPKQVKTESGGALELKFPKYTPTFNMDEDDDDDDEDEDLTLDESYEIIIDDHINGDVIINDPLRKYAAKTIHTAHLKVVLCDTDNKIYKSLRDIALYAIMLLSGPVLAIKRGNEKFKECFMNKFIDFDVNRIWVHFVDGNCDGDLLVFYMDSESYDTYQELMKKFESSRIEIDFIYGIFKMLFDRHYSMFTTLDDVKKYIEKNESSDEDVEYFASLVEADEDTKVGNGNHDTLVELSNTSLVDILARENVCADSVYPYFTILDKYLSDSEIDKYLDKKYNIVKLPSDWWLNPPKKKSVDVPVTVYNIETPIYRETEKVEDIPTDDEIEDISADDEISFDNNKKEEQSEEKKPQVTVVKADDFKSEEKPEKFTVETPKVQDVESNKVQKTATETSPEGIKRLGGGQQGTLVIKRHN